MQNKEKSNSFEAEIWSPKKTLDKKIEHFFTDILLHALLLFQCLTQLTDKSILLNNSFGAFIYFLRSLLSLRKRYTERLDITSCCTFFIFTITESRCVCVCLKLFVFSGQKLTLNCYLVVFLQKVPTGYFYCISTNQ